MRFYNEHTGYERQAVSADLTLVKVASTRNALMVGPRALFVYFRN
jgi:hypothetical protein